MVELDVKIGSGDLYDYLLRHTYNTASGIIGSCSGALLIVLAFMTGQWRFLIFGGIILLYLPVTGFQNRVDYDLNGEGLRISKGEDFLQYAWEDMVKAVSTGHSIILYTSRVNATIFPKEQLGDKRMAVIEMIATHMPPSKVKIRG